MDRFSQITDHRTFVSHGTSCMTKKSEAQVPGSDGLGFKCQLSVMLGK